jgi:hypothetical protein
LADELERERSSQQPAQTSQVSTPTYTPTLDRFIAASAGHEGIRLDRLEPLTELVVRTWHSTYEILVADPKRFRIILRGGRNFPIPTAATLRGSTLGGHCLKVGWIGTGFNMEIQAGDIVAVTSPVQSIEFGRSPRDRQSTSEEDTDATTHSTARRHADAADAERAPLGGMRVQKH